MPGYGEGPAEERALNGQRIPTDFAGTVGHRSETAATEPWSAASFARPKGSPPLRFPPAVTALVRPTDVASRTDRPFDIAFGLELFEGGDNGAARKPVLKCEIPAAR